MRRGEAVSLATCHWPLGTALFLALVTSHSLLAAALQRCHSFFHDPRGTDRARARQARIEATRHAQPASLPSASSLPLRSPVCPRLETLCGTQHRIMGHDSSATTRLVTSRLSLDTLSRPRRKLRTTDGSPLFVSGHRFSISEVGRILRKSLLRI